jgi:GNAT superfamily N-acetyltransferase
MRQVWTALPPDSITPKPAASAQRGSVRAQALSIRPAGRDDLPAAVRLFALPDEGNTKGDHAAEPLDARYLAAFDAIVDDPNNRLFIAERDAQLVGVFQLTIVQYIAYRGARVAQIENVVVVPTERSAGVGAEMMLWAIEEARRRGCSRVQLTSRKGRTRAHAFYERLGFSRSHEGFRLTL